MSDSEKGARIGGFIFEAVSKAGAKARAMVVEPLGEIATDSALNALANSVFFLIIKLRSNVSRENKVETFLKHFQASCEIERG